MTWQLAFPAANDPREQGRNIMSFMIQPWESVIHKLVPLAMQVRQGVGTAPGHEYSDDRTLGTILEVGWYLKIKYLTPFYRNFHFTCRTQDFCLIYSILNLLYFILRILAIRNLIITHLLLG